MGSVVLLVFLATYDDDCRREIPHLVGLHERHAARGLVVLGVTYEKEEDVKPWLDKYKVPFPVVKGQANDYKMKLIPTGFVIDERGKILWRGHTNPLDETWLTKVVIGAKPPSVLQGLGDVYLLRQEQKNGEAYQKIDELLQAGALSEAAVEQAKGWQEEDRAAVAEAIRSADAAKKDGDVYQHWLHLDAITNRYAGVPGDLDAASQLKELLASKRNQKEIDAGKKLDEARALEAAFDFSGAYEIYKDVGRRAGSTKAGKFASDRCKQMEKDGMLGYDHACHYCRAGGAACPQHRKK
jgi:hypothetical protein